MATFPVKYLHSAMQGAPTLSGTAGSLISVLDACLINGFNVLAPVSITVAAGEATVDYGTVHGYAAHDIIKVAGATPAELNGEQRITWVNSTIVKFATTAADGTATGTLETRTAPVGGWEKTYTGTNKGVYRQTDITGTRLYLRVDDTPTTYANVTMFESMTDVDTGTAPTNRVWIKSNAANTTTREWRLIGDGLMFYLAAYWHSNYLTQAGINTFGDINTYKSGDAFHCMLGGEDTVNTNSPGGRNFFSRQDGGDTTCLLSRSYSQIGQNVTTGHLGLRNQNDIGYEGFVFPNPTDNGLLLHTPLIVTEPTTNAARGTMPGLIQPLQHAPLTDGFVVENIPQMPGKRVLMVGVGRSYTYSEARVSFDITGPWR